jgi:large subunit ribosomal protein L18e
MMPRRIEDLRVMLDRARRTEDADIWEVVGERLSTSKRTRVETSLAKISRNTSPNDVVVVPGKVLANGFLTYAVTVAAYDFSHRAYERIESVGGEAITIETLVERNPGGKGVRIIV